MAGFLLWIVIKAWTSDRTMVTQLLGEFRTAISSLTTAVERLTERLDHMENKNK